MTLSFVTTGSPALATPGVAYRTAAIAANRVVLCFMKSFPARVERGEYRTASRARLGGRGLSLRLSAQCFAEVFEQLRELARHHGEVDVELLGRVDIAAVGRVLRHFEELEPLHLQFVREHEGD